MKNDFYFQHPLMAMCDPRMQNLLDHEGLRGVGVYWFIRERLAMMPDSCGTFEEISAYCKSRRAPSSYLRKILCEYGLFDFLSEEYFTPSSLNPPRNLQQEVDDFAQKTAENVSDNAVSCAENDKKQQKTHRIDSKNRAKIQRKTPKISVLARSDSNTIKENIKDIITTAATTENKETAAAEIPHGVKKPRDAIETLHEGGALVGVVDALCPDEPYPDSRRICQPCFPSGTMPRQMAETAPPKVRWFATMQLIGPKHTTHRLQPRISVGTITHVSIDEVCALGP